MGGHHKSSGGGDDEDDEDDEDGDGDNGRGGTGSGVAPAPAPAATDLAPLARSGGVTTTSSGGGYHLPPYARYPYMASLQLEGHDPSSTDGGGSYDAHVCSGALVAPDLVMTSAHCARYAPPGTDETVQAFNGIEVGRSDLDDPGVDFDPYRLDAYSLYYENLVPDELIVHPQYDASTYEHDVMLVKVYGKSRFPPVALGPDEVNFRRGTAVGWGAESSESRRKFSNMLRSADVEMMTNDECRDIVVGVRDPDTGLMSELALRDHVYDDMMCASTSASSAEGGRQICYGDAGGPVMLEGTDSDADVVYGILSWGYGCMDPEYPAVMTRISDHYDWIRDAVCRESSDPPEWYDCPPGMSMMSSEGGGGSTTTVTLKLRLDAMAVETGFVIEVRETREVVAQRQTGYYKAEINKVLFETFDLPVDRCYTLILLDSYGDGFCCDMGGGNAVLFAGTDVGHKTGHKLVEVNGNFEFDNRGEFCLTGGGVIQASSSDAVPPPNPPTISSGPYGADPMRPPPPPPDEPHPDDDSSSWNGPEEPGANPFHLPDTGDPQETDEFQNSSEYYTPSSQHYISVQFQFDENPEEISWVLFDLVANEARVFVDYGTYLKDEYANKLLTIPITMDGPEMGEKQYVFTVYDEASDGLCCDRGEGYYKVFLGNVEDDHELLGDSVFEFSSSYYFTLFETEDATANLLSQDVTADFQDQNATVTVTAESNVTVTSAPTPVPSEEPTSEPTSEPTEQPTYPPSRSPTSHPTLSPTTASPTNPWEIQRPEDIAAIGARWSVPSKTLPGSFNDVGGDQEKYSLNVDRAMIVSAANIDSSTRGSLAVGVVFVCSLFLAIIR